MSEDQANGSSDLADFDLTEAAEEGAVLEVRNPKTQEVMRHSDGRPFTVKLVGRDSERFLKLARSQSDRRIQQTMRTRLPASTVSIEKDDIELLANATLDWDIILDGEKPPANVNKYREVYTKYRFLREQVDEFVGNRSNFLKD